MLNNYLINKKIQIEVNAIKADFTHINKSNLKNFYILIKKSIIAIQREKKIIFFGNGGSAAHAQHLATEITVKFKKKRRALPAISITTDTSAITAIGNDFKFEKIFSRQIEAIGNSGDIAVGITTSGNSANIVNALREANKKKITTFCFVGNKKSKAAKNSNYPILTTGNSVSAIQILQIFLGQIYCEFLENYFK